MILEKLSYDLIDREFFHIFRPIYVTQYVFGALRFRIEDKFITPVSFGQKLFTLFMMIISSFSFYYVTFDTSAIGISNDNIHLSILAAVQYSMTYLVYCLIVLTNIFHNKYLNSLIYVYMQNIDRHLKLNKTSGSYDLLNKRTTIVTSITLCFYGFWYFWYVFVFTQHTIYTYYNYIISLFGFMSFTVVDLEMVAFSVILNFMILRVDCIKMLINERRGLKWRHLIVYSPDEEVSSESIFRAFESLTLVYNILVKIYAFYMFLINCYALTSMLIIIGRWIIMAGDVTLNVIIMSIFGIVMVTSRIIFVCIACHQFHIQLATLLSACRNYIDSAYSNDSDRKLIKNIVRVLNVRMQKFTVFGMFTLDALLPLRVLALTTTYTVVLLQFAFLQ